MRGRINWCALLPAYREKAHVGAVVQAARAAGAEVIVVDDGSDDGTAEAAEAEGAHVIRHPANRGKGAALATGFAEVRRRGYDVVVTLDADGQHDPAELPKFIETYQRTGIPVLIGSRMSDDQGMPWIRRLTNRLMSRLLSRLMGHYIPDTQCGYRLYRSDLLPLVATGASGFAAESEVLLRLAARGVRMDVVRVRTLYGNEKSKIRPLADTVRFLRMLARYRKELRALRKPRAQA